MPVRIAPVLLQILLHRNLEGTETSVDQQDRGEKILKFLLVLHFHMYFVNSIVTLKKMVKTSCPAARITRHNSDFIAF